MRRGCRTAPHPQSLPLPREVDSPQGEDGGRDNKPADFGKLSCFAIPVFSPSVTCGGSRAAISLAPCSTGVLFLFFSGKKRNQKKPAKGKGCLALPLGTPTRETCERFPLFLSVHHRVGIVTLRHPTARFPTSLTRALRWKSVGFSCSHALRGSL